MGVSFLKIYHFKIGMDEAEKVRNMIGNISPKLKDQILKPETLYSKFQLKDFGHII